MCSKYKKPLRAELVQLMLWLTRKLLGWIGTQLEVDSDSSRWFRLRRGDSLRTQQDSRGAQCGGPWIRRFWGKRRNQVMSHIIRGNLFKGTALFFFLLSSQFLFLLEEKSTITERTSWQLLCYLRTVGAAKLGFILEVTQSKVLATIILVTPTDETNNKNHFYFKG